MKYGIQVFDYGQAKIAYLQTGWGVSVSIPLPQNQKKLFVRQIIIRKALRSGIAEVANRPRFTRFKKRLNRRGSVKRGRR